MTVREQVYLLLEKNRDKSISGEEIATQLNVSRTSIWKAVKALSEEGYEIEAVNNKGYRLVGTGDILSAAYIEKELGKEGIHLPLQVLKETVSTNNDLKQLATEGELRDYIILSGCQTGGKGRRGRTFFSPKDSGLYISILLHPNTDAREGAMLTTLAATAEAMAIEELTGMEIGIKWVNDVIYQKKKISGILTECSLSMEDGKLEYAIVGAGINVYEPAGGFPKELANVAGFLLSEQQSNFRNRLAVAFVKHFMAFYQEFPNKVFFAEYRNRSVVLGKEIYVLPAGIADLNNIDYQTCQKAQAKDIDEECGLVVTFEDGHEETLSNGEVSVRL